jgi:hypothetical protein
VIYPVMPGPASATSARPAKKRAVRLIETRTVDDLAYLTYEVVR